MKNNPPKNNSGDKSQVKPLAVVQSSHGIFSSEEAAAESLLGTGSAFEIRSLPGVFSLRRDSLLMVRSKESFICWESAD